MKFPLKLKELIAPDTFRCSVECSYSVSCWALNSIYSYMILYRVIVWHRHQRVKETKQKNTEAKKKYCSHSWLNASVCIYLWIKFQFFCVHSLSLSSCMYPLVHTMNYIRNYISSKVTEFSFYMAFCVCLCVLCSRAHIHSTNSWYHKWQQQKHVLSSYQKTQAKSQWMSCSMECLWILYGFMSERRKTPNDVDNHTAVLRRIRNPETTQTPWKLHHMRSEKRMVLDTWDNFHAAVTFIGESKSWTLNCPLLTVEWAIHA